jgi:hypothetical protein
MKPQFNFNYIVVSNLSCELTFQNSLAKTRMDRREGNRCSELGRVEVKQKKYIKCVLGYVLRPSCILLLFCTSYRPLLRRYFFVHMQFIPEKLIAKSQQ